MIDVKAPERLAGLSRVLRVLLAREDESLSLLLRIREESTGAEVEYEFTDVTNLRFRSQVTELNQLVLLLSEDVSPDGWEESRYRIKDYEEEFISFLCSRIRCASA